MYVRSTRDRIPGTSHRGRKSTNGSRQSPRSRWLGTPKEPQRAQRLDGVHQLLQEIHRRILQHRESSERTHQKGSTLGVDRRARRSFPEAKTANMRRTGAPHAKTRGTVRTGSRRIKLCGRSNVKPERRTESVAPGGVLFHNTLRSGEK